MRKQLTRIGVSLLIFGFRSVLFAQQNPTYTQYMYNPTTINPAYAASRESISIFGLYRNQWMGIDGAPKTANLGVTTPLQNSKLGLGVNFTNDHIGAMNENNIAVDLAYTVNLNAVYKLALGVKGNVNLLSLSYSKLNIYDQAGPFNYDDFSNKFSPNIGAGAYFYSDLAYLGLSVPQMFTVDYYDDVKRITMREYPVCYLMGGYIFDLGADWLLKPAFLSKISKGQTEMNVTANFLFQEKFTIGTSYRWNSSFSALTGFQIDSNWFIGYAYDFDTTKLNHYNVGTHELFMRFDWGGRWNSNTKSTRRFF
ncbi:PorP/SprF family type IX secretion system membrane protein [Myroides fluvii]|uniref:PorP/SprF family type IX secretion system membrane protein n=1 Tax=Myroides fluvii TaxID=2572594 RepID=UPI0018EEF1A7|nr:type IX secretion system membrane protein PorP/SprF [Myroides fluvii]